MALKLDVVGVHVVVVWVAAKGRLGAWIKISYAS